MRVCLLPSAPDGKPVVVPYFLRAVLLKTYTVEGILPKLFMKPPVAPLFNLAQALSIDRHHFQSPKRMMMLTGVMKPPGGLCCGSVDRQLSV